ALFHFSGNSSGSSLHCRDLLTGKLIWKSAVGQRQRWIDGTTLYLEPRPVDRWKGPQYTLTALEAETGKEIAGRGIRLSGLEWVQPLLGKKAVQFCFGKKGGD